MLAKHQSKELVLTSTRAAINTSFVKTDPLRWLRCLKVRTQPRTAGQDGEIQFSAPNGGILASWRVNDNSIEVHDTDFVLPPATALWAKCTHADALKVDVGYDLEPAARLGDRGILGAAPTITSLDVATGVEAGGTAVVITGTGFQPGAQVTFDGNFATNCVVTAPTTISCVTPAGAGEIDVAVHNPDNQSVTEADAYTYT